MIFQHTWEKVLDGTKTKIRQRVRPNHGWTTALSVGVIGKDAGKVLTTAPSYSIAGLDGFKNIYSVVDKRSNGAVYFVGGTYSVQPESSHPVVWWRRNENGSIDHDGSASEYRSFARRAWLTKNDFHPAYILVKSICYDKDVRAISDEDARAEGFDDRFDFWHAWVEMHDNSFYETFCYACDTDQLDSYGFHKRPDTLYRAWVLNFELVEGAR